MYGTEIPQRVEIALITGIVPKLKARVSFGES